jgi:hypothetical protein
MKGYYRSPATRPGPTRSDRVLAVWVFWLRPELDQVAQGATDALHTPVARTLILVGQIDALCGWAALLLI